MKIETSVNLMLSEANVMFWDFDGVIKDSVNVKTEAFANLFKPYGHEVSMRVRQHHENNGGMSRFDKIPIYLSWTGETVTRALTIEFCDQFSAQVMQAVIYSPWVAGVREYLLNNCEKQYFVLVTATPQEEIEQILSILHISHCFREVYGTPSKKAFAINKVLINLGCMRTKALMIGDSEIDMLAAQENSIPFLLRRTPQNLFIQQRNICNMFDDLSS